MKIALVSTSISRNNGGVSEVEKKMAQMLLNVPDIEVQIYALRDKQTMNDLPSWNPLKPVIFDFVGPSSFAYSPKFVSALKHSGADLIHLHGLWQYTSIAALRSNIPYITTIHGMLDQWAIKNSWLKKFLASLLYEKSALKNAKCLHAITEQEYIDIRNFGLTNPVCIIPNGIDLPQNIGLLKEQDPVWKHKIDDNKKILLYLGRLHPKKGLTNLIKAWQQFILKNKKNDWNLIIAGWDQGGYEKKLINLSKDLNLRDTIHFIGPQFGKNKELVFAHADAFILPSFSEGLPMVVLEAWSYQLPVLMTRQCNLPEGFKANAAFEITTSIEEIVKGLEYLFHCSEEDLSNIGDAGRNLVSANFNWHSVIERMSRVYKWIIGESEIPESIILK
jgi:poly(glycerol-phosphate) alpha-glucosyltransferase